MQGASVCTGKLSSIISGLYRGVQNHNSEENIMTLRDTNNEILCNPRNTKLVNIEKNYSFCLKGFSNFSFLYTGFYSCFTHVKLHHH